MFTTSPTNSVAGSALATQPKVTVEDAYGNVVTTNSSTASLAITSTTPTSGGPGTLTGCTQSGETNGVISFTGCEINTAGVGYELHATDGTLTVVNSSAFNVTAGTATQLVFTTSPTNSVAGSALATQPKVTVEDAYGNVVTTNSSTASLAITSTTPTSGGPGTLTGCTQSGETNGVISFTGCEINTAGVGYELHATDGTLTAVNSSAFNVTAGPATQLVFTTSPTNSVAGSALATQPKVTVEDAYGNVVTTNSSTASLAITSLTPTSGGPGTLTGCTQSGETNGVISFTGCEINTAGVGYELHATDGTLTAVNSSMFNVTAGTATKLVFTTSPTNSVAGSAPRDPAGGGGRGRLRQRGDFVLVDDHLDGLGRDVVVMWGPDGVIGRRDGDRLHIQRHRGHELHPDGRVHGADVGEECVLYTDGQRHHSVQARLHHLTGGGGVGSGLLDPARGEGGEPERQRGDFLLVGDHLGGLGAGTLSSCGA